MTINRIDGGNMESLFSLDIGKSLSLINREPAAQRSDTSIIDRIEEFDPLRRFVTEAYVV